MKMILASGSPRRINMMKEKGHTPDIMPADVNEKLPFEMDMESAVMYLALKKALWVEAQIKSGSDASFGQSMQSSTHGEDAPVIIAADTIVYKDRIIGKPGSPEEAFQILSSLRNTWHYVATGVCLMRAGTPFRETFYEVTKVFFKDYSDEELRAYLKTNEAYDKAGGYAIQGTFAKYIDHFEGDYDNVVGFPWARIEKELNKAL